MLVQWAEIIFPSKTGRHTLLFRRRKQKVIKWWQLGKTVLGYGICADKRQVKALFVPMCTGQSSSGEAMWLPGYLRLMLWWYFSELKQQGFPASTVGSASSSFPAWFWEQHQTPQHAASWFCAWSEVGWYDAVLQAPDREKICSRRMFPMWGSEPGMTFLPACLVSLQLSYCLWWNCGRREITAIHQQHPEPAHPSSYFCLHLSIASSSLCLCTCQAFRTGMAVAASSFLSSLKDK